jgi:F420-dependent oxidoreductase-like protein
MRVRIITEPQDGASYDDQLRLARAAEELGYDGYFRSDHYLKMVDRPGLPGPTDAWTTVAGLARETRTIRLGVLMTAATFRLPGPLAIAVAQVDAMSGGRVECGLGAGWYAEEHGAYGIPLPSPAERFERLEEQLAIVTGLWATPVGACFDFTGRHYTLRGAPALPKPVQRPRPPMLVGGSGRVRTPRLAARYADEFNLPYASVADTAAAFARVRAACVAAGRDPGTLRYSASQALCCGRDRATLARRADAIGRDLDELRRNGLAGTPAEVVDKIGAFAAVGVDTLYVQAYDLSDLDHLELVAGDVIGQLR